MNNKRFNYEIVNFHEILQCSKLCVVEETNIDIIGRYNFRSGKTQKSLCKLDKFHDYENCENKINRNLSDIYNSANIDTFRVI